MSSTSTANPTSSSYNFLPSPSAYDPSSTNAGFTNGVTDYSDILSSTAPGNSLLAPTNANDAPLDPSLFSSAGADATAGSSSHMFPFEVTSPGSSVGAGGAGGSGAWAVGSPASTADSAPTPASTTSDAFASSAGAGAAAGKKGAGGGGGRKRKSDAVEVESPAASEDGSGTGARRSQRKRRA